MLTSHTNPRSKTTAIALLFPPNAPPTLFSGAEKIKHSLSSAFVALVGSFSFATISFRRFVPSLRSFTSLSFTPFPLPFISPTTATAQHQQLLSSIPQRTSPIAALRPVIAHAFNPRHHVWYALFFLPIVPQGSATEKGHF